MLILEALDQVVHGTSKLFVIEASARNQALSFVFGVKATLHPCKKLVDMPVILCIFKYLGYIGKLGLSLKNCGCLASPLLQNKAL